MIATQTDNARSVPEAFKRHAEGTPDRVAVAFRERRWTYRELDQAAVLVAGGLRAAGVGPDVPVGICVPRSLELMAGIFGIWKAGGAYVPLDTAYPPARLSLMLEDCAAPVLLVSSSTAGLFRPATAKLLRIEELIAGDRASLGSDSEAPAEPDDLAYVIYTSGSTGRPKGVEIPHRALSNLVRSMARCPGFSENEMSAAISNVSFDLSVAQLFPPLSMGGCILIVPEEVTADGERLGRLIAGEGVTTLFATPASWQLLVDAGWKGHGQLTAVSCGEALPRRLAEELLVRVGSLWNAYGPTETTVFAAILRVTSGTGPVPIGGPIDNTVLVALSPDGTAVADGSAGELCIGGDGLARGYRSNPELTEARFIPAPCQPSTRLYRTGDLVRRRPDGNFEFLGRIDHQLKIRGFRVEPGEIEAALCAAPSVTAAAVVARDTPSGERQLAAFVAASAMGLSERELRAHLARTLPDYMVPVRYTFLDRLPLTPNGKADRDALRGMPLEPPAFAHESPPVDSVEETIAQIWSDVFGIGQIGAQQDFFGLGGSSLAAGQVIARIRERLGVSVSLGRFHETPTIAGLAASVRSGDGDSSPAPRPSPSNGKAFPLSSAQERVWFIEQLAPGNRAYAFQCALHFDGPLDIPVLQTCLTEIVRRHQVFRSTFGVLDSQLRQIAGEAQRVHLAVTDLRSVPEGEREAESRRLRDHEFQRPFDLGLGPPIRWSVHRLGDRSHVLLHHEHHLVHDGWSFRLFAGELLRLYSAFSQGQPTPLPEPPQFGEFALTERAWLEGPAAAQQLSYWKSYLRSGLPPLALPHDRPRPARQSFAGETLVMELPLPLCRAVREFCRREGMSLYTFLLAAFQAFTHRYTGQPVVSAGCSVANRKNMAAERVIGMFVNNVVVQSELSGDPSFLEFLREVRAWTVSAQENSDIPFDRVVAALGADRDLSYNPLFQVMFNLHDAPLPDIRLPELCVRFEEIISNHTAKFDLSVIAIPHSSQLTALGSGQDPESIRFIWEYATDLFDESTIRRMACHYSNLMEAAIVAPSRRISELALLGPEEEQRQLVAWNQTRREYPPVCIHELFEAQAARTPDAEALWYGGERVSYAELNTAANRLARYLLRLGAAPESPIGVCLRRRPDLIATILAVLKTGAPYVPIDPAYPAARRELLLEDSGARLVVTDSQAATDMRAGAAHMVFIDSERERIALESASDPGIPVGPDSLAYIIYTSGSTGRPSGVAIEHRSAGNLLHWARDFYSAGSRSRALATSSVCFDLSVFEIFVPLAWGGAVILIEDLLALPDLPASAAPTLINTVPSAMGELLRHYRLPPSVQVVNLAGEPLGEPLVRRIYEQGSGCEVFDLYGPTECTTYSTAARREPGQRPTIGRPIANTTAFVLDGNRRPVPLGVRGELYLGGAGLARGYWRREELTRDRFAEHRFGADSAGRLYRTGDLVRYLPGGDIEFLGRLDEQVKVRGFRIEPGEIEAALERRAGIRAAAVVSREDTPGQRRIVAYVESKEAGVDERELGEFLESVLPRYMVPARIFVLEALPRTPNGKTDRRLLPAPDSLPAVSIVSTRAPEHDSEHRLADIWRKALGVESVGTDDNFFRLGGDSLMAMQVVRSIEAEFERRLDLRTLFDGPTIRQVSRWLKP
ncbi:MAG: amino acid adenylation domain-containing protein [Bryobacteraceae bacterium]|nr:amino acid adenylation domain-containing protein [Bryobacteraceae bacterium]